MLNFDDVTMQFDNADNVHVLSDRNILNSHFFLATTTLEEPIKLSACELSPPHCTLHEMNGMKKLLLIR